MKKRSVRQTAIELRGTKIYQYDVETLEYVGEYDCIGDAADDNDLSASTLGKMTRKYPLGYIKNDLMFTRVLL